MFEPGKEFIHMRGVAREGEVFLISVELGIRCSDLLQAAAAELGPCADLPAHLTSCTGPDGKPYAYVVSRELWNAVSHELKAGEKELFLKSGSVRPEPLGDFRKFMEFFDCPYEYQGTVRCPNCGKETEDWRTDPKHSFSLSNANLGGLLVFQCSGCGGTIRQKHFQDGVVVEFTPSQCATLPR